MSALVCDICGGRIEMQSGGTKGICESCGVSYSIDRLKEIHSGMKVSVTGTKEDVQQWKSLVNTYLKTGDFMAVEDTIKKILAAVPTDEFANDIYTKLQDWKHYEIRNGVLVKYNGFATNTIIPDCVTSIGKSSFSNCNELKTVFIPASVNSICDSAFSECLSLEKINFSKGLKIIGKNAFFKCNALIKVELPDTLVEIDEGAFSYCDKLSEITIPDSLQRIKASFFGCSNLKSVKTSHQVRKLLGNALHGTEQSKLWSNAGLCEYCGNKLDSMFTCIECRHTNENAFPVLLNAAYNLLCRSRNKVKIYTLLMQHFERNTSLRGLKQKNFTFINKGNDIYLCYEEKGYTGWFNCEEPLYLCSSNIIDAIDFVKRNI